MASYVTGAAPVSFIAQDASEAGAQVQIPLAALAITASGDIDGSAWIAASGLAAADQTLAGQVLSDLWKRGVIKPSS